MKILHYGTVVYACSLRMEKAELPAASYDAFREFVKNVVKTDRLQVVLSGKS